MIKVLLKYKWYIAAILLLIIIEPTINSILNFWLQKIFNATVPNADKIMILRLLTTGFLLWISKRVVVFTSSVLQNRYICNAKQDVKHQIFVSLLRLNTSNIGQFTSSGEYISLFSNDIILLEQRFFQQIISLIANLFSVAILGTSFLALNSKIAVFILLFGMIAMLVPALFSKKLNEKSLSYSNSISSFTQKLKEYLVAYPTIKNYSVEDAIVSRFDRQNRRTEDLKFESDYWISLANNVGMLLAWFMQFIAVGFGIILVVKGEIIIGTVIAAQNFASDLASPLQNIIINVNSIRSVQKIVAKMNELTAPEQLHPLPAETAHPSVTPPPAADRQTHYDVEFQDVSLCIGGKNIIDHFSFTFESGKKYLMVGLNGSGKSSLFRALKKWFPGCQGRILLGGRDIASLDNEEISRVVSYLNEKVSLFSGSIRENISLFRSCSPESFQWAVDSAHVTLDLERTVQDEGQNISSGEQRRIEIARSLLRSIQVMIFDEVISTLDIETAYEIEKLALDFQDKTIIFISHNFSGKLIRQYDEILVMDEGRLLSHGSYDQLMASCPYFKRICQIKFGIGTI